MENYTKVEPNNENIEYIGRFLKEESGKVSFSWSSSKIAFDTTATDVYIELESCVEPIYYNLYINGEKKNDFQIKKGVQKILLFSEMEKSNKSIVIERRNELLAGRARLHGIHLKGGCIQKHSNKKDRYIEFIGDSLTAGYGVYSKSPTDPFNHSEEDSSSAHAAIAAKLVDSDYSIVAYSGKGVYRDYNKSKTEPMPFFYPLVNRFPKADWDFSGRKPDLIVINLGTNDFGQGIPPREEFINSYINFVKEIEKLNGKSNYLLVCGHMESNKNENISYIKDVASTLKKQGFDVELFVMPYIDQTLPQGADYHPGLEQHKIAGEFLAKEIKKIMKW